MFVTSYCPIWHMQGSRRANFLAAVIILSECIVSSVSWTSCCDLLYQRPWLSLLHRCLQCHPLRQSYLQLYEPYISHFYNLITFSYKWIHNNTNFKKIKNISVMIIIIVMIRLIIIMSGLNNAAVPL